MPIPVVLAHRPSSSLAWCRLSADCGHSHTATGRRKSRPSCPRQRLAVSPRKQSFALDFWSCWRIGSRQFV